MNAVTQLIAEAGTWRRFPPVVSVVSRSTEGSGTISNGGSGTMSAVQLIASQVFEYRARRINCFASRSNVLRCNFKIFRLKLGKTDI